jgi:hypothetical protein
LRLGAGSCTVFDQRRLFALLRILGKALNDRDRWQRPKDLSILAPESARPLARRLERLRRRRRSRYLRELWEGVVWIAGLALLALLVAGVTARL